MNAYEQAAIRWQSIAAARAAKAMDGFRLERPFWQREAAFAAAMAQDYLSYAIEARAYALRQN